ncbi:MAG: Na+/H+ antiporter NhaA [Chloroflexi bacterium]|nr:Na+/H+ antiporter NhaA [Chloroflexota bacterium]
MIDSLRHAQDRRLALRRARVNRFTRPVQEFIATETAGGLVLLVAAVIALIWANSPWSHHYHDLLHHHLMIDIGIWSLDETLHFWINDAAMVVFFFVVGLEIKRETVVGELSDLRRVIVPIAGAIGGMVVPALIFTMLVAGNPGASGWGIPLATDIAFALGVLAVVGKRVPFSLRVMLLAVAIVDDIGGIIVIAVFYTSELSFLPLGLAIGTLGLALILRQSGVWYLPIYVALGIVAWAATVDSGIHPTIVGVLLGILAPWKAWYREEGFARLAQHEVARFEEASHSADEGLAHDQKTHALRQLQFLTNHSIAPLDRLEHELQPLVAFVIVPVFAFANAGVSIDPDTIGAALTAPVTLGVFFGLLLGKPLGIFAGIWLAVRAGATLPVGVNWLGVLGTGILGGIGFTVSLLITELSFTHESLIVDAKLGIISASAIAGIVGFLVLRLVYPPDRQKADS